MPRHSRTRWLMAGLLILALFSGSAFVSNAVRKETATRSVRERPLSPAETPAAGGDHQDRPRRVHDAGAAAEAKLRSLLEVREGEISCIRIPAHLMAGFPPGPLGDGLVGRPTGPDVVGILSRDAVLEGLKNLRSGGGTIDGSVDADAGEFDWSGGRLQVTGTATTAADSVQLKIEAREGGSTLECQTRLPPGGIVFLRSSHPDPEGILLVVGQRADGEKPGPEPEKAGP